MKESVSKISIIIYVVLLILSGFLASAEGGRVGFFCIMGIFAIPPIVAGPKKYKVLGIIALLIAIAAAAFDYHAGKRTQYKIDEKRKQHEEISILRTDGVEGIILPSSKAVFVAQITSRKELESWTPCEPDIAEAIIAIRIFLAKQAPSIANRLTVSLSMGRKGSTATSSIARNTKRTGNPILFLCSMVETGTSSWNMKLNQDNA